MVYRDKKVCRAVHMGVPKGVRVFGLAGTFHEEVAKELGLPFIVELWVYSFEIISDSKLTAAAKVWRCQVQQRRNTGH